MSDVLETRVETPLTDISGRTSPSSDLTRQVLHAAHVKYYTQHTRTHARRNTRSVLNYHDLVRGGVMCCGMLRVLTWTQHTRW